MLRGRVHRRWRAVGRCVGVVACVGLGVTACSSDEAGAPDTQAPPTTTTTEITTTTEAPGVDTVYESVDDIRTAVEAGGFVCAEWEVHSSSGDFGESENASCVGVLVFTVYESGTPALDVAGSADGPAHYLVGPNWSVTCEDRRDICGSLLPLVGGEVVTATG